MTTWARKVDGHAVDVTATSPTLIFPPDVAAQFITVPDGTLNGAQDDGHGGWINPTPFISNAETPPTVYAVLEPATFLGLLLAVGLTKTQLGNARDDANLRWLWVIFDALQHGVEHPDAGTQGSSLTSEGFADLVAYGYLSSDQVAAAKAAWPKL